MLVATREDEAIGIAVGAWFAGKKPLVFMQNSGLGNCIDIITSLLKPYGINIDLLIQNRKEPEHHEAMFYMLDRTMGYRDFYDLMDMLEYESFTLH